MSQLSRNEAIVLGLLSEFKRPVLRTKLVNSDSLVTRVFRVGSAA